MDCDRLGTDQEGFVGNRVGLVHIHEPGGYGMDAKKVDPSTGILPGRNEPLFRSG